MILDNREKERGRGAEERERERGEERHLGKVTYQ